ncbi:MAG: hypothetical protein KME22_03935 [Hassallia sp. WJT32-NPBG1]|nr:hypothetical protein [Hassallia sp. WJT32-NPBG1]
MVRGVIKRFRVLTNINWLADNKIDIPHYAARQHPRQQSDNTQNQYFQPVSCLELSGVGWETTISQLRGNTYKSLITVS